jgi:hypothetical protein
MKLGERQFTDGTTRPVYGSDGGLQLVLDHDGEQGYGVWPLPDEYCEPVILAPGTLISRRN